MKILIVDDQSYNRDLLRFIMEDEGHTCIDAEDGQKAIDCVEQEGDIDIILMDVNMPVMGGIESASHIAQKKQEHHIAIIFVTAMDNGEILTQCLNAGGDDFIPKPVNESILIAKINAHSRSINNHKQLALANKKLDIFNSRTRREHDIVETVFKNVQSLAPTKIDNITSYTSPMSMFNGDAMLSCASPSGGAYFLVGDFTGHGLSAAIGSLPVMSIFYNNAKRQSSVSEIARDINTQLHKILPLGLFFCASIGHLDKDGKKLILWSGGMNDILLLNHSTQKVTPIAGDHMPLGIHNKNEFEDKVQIHHVSPNDKLYFYTDGINEAQNKNNDMFGEQRIIDIIESYDHTLPQNVIFHIVNEVKSFTEGTEQDDDITILELVCNECSHKNPKTGETVDISENLHSINCFPWRLDISLHPDDLKATDTVHQVVAFLGTIPKVELHQDKIFTIFSELYNNALEHGVLGLSSSLKNSPDGFEQYYKMREERLASLSEHCISINLEYIKSNINNIRIEIKDSGVGFDAKEAFDQVNANEQSHGRGIGLVKQLCSSLEYKDNGTRVIAHYEFTQ